MTEKEIEAVNYRPYPAADDAVVFPTLADSELVVLEALGTRREVAVGEYLYREGDPCAGYFDHPFSKMHCLIEVKTESMNGTSSS